MEKIYQIDLEQIKHCPGFHIAISWIRAAHDYEAILYLDGKLREIDKIEHKPSQFINGYRDYFTRLRTAQTREAIGLCKKTRDYPNLLEMIMKGKNGSSQAFERLSEMSDAGPKNNLAMRIVRDIRNSTFHYCLDDSEMLYLKSIETKIKRGEKAIRINPKRSVPDRFELADELYNELFLTQILQVDLKDLSKTEMILNETAEAMAQMGDDVGNVARSLSQGFIENYGKISFHRRKSG